MKAYVVDEAAVRNNIRVVLKRAAGTPVWAVVKGDGYGIGALELARLCLAEGIALFAVTEPREARLLREHGFNSERILMLRSTTEADELEELLDLKVICTIGSYEAAVALNGIAERRAAVAEAHIKIDTGMGRYGFLPTETDKILSVYEYMKAIQVTGMYTHFHSAFCSEKETYRQFNEFKTVAARVSAAGQDPGMLHCCNSSAFFRYESMRMDAVRVGSALLGRLAFPSSMGLRAVGYCEATVEELRWLPAGHTVGYGAAWKAKRPTRIAIVSVGTFHGFATDRGHDLFRPRDCLREMLSWGKAMVRRKRLTVRLNGKTCPVLGHVGMLHTAFDVTDVPCALGDRVTLEINPLMVKGLDIEYRKNPE